MNPSDIAISVKNVSKIFRIPHEKVSSIRGAFTSAAKGFFPPLQRRSPAYAGGGGESANRRGSSSVHPSPESLQALNNVSFEIKKGEFFGIIG